MANSNFKWLTNDIDASLVLKIIYKKDDKEEDYAIFNVMDVMDATSDKLDIETANINDLTNLLTVGIVRFVNVNDISDILDIPFRNLYKLYEEGNLLGDSSSEKLVSFKELEAFSVIDGSIKNDYLVFSALISKPSEDLEMVMKTAYEFMNYGMKEQFEAMNNITLINHRRLQLDNKNRSRR